MTSTTLALSLAQRGFAAADVRLAAVGNSLRDETDCSVGIVTCSTRDGLAGTSVAIKKPGKRGNCLVANLSVWVRRQDVREVCYDVGNAEVICAAPLTGKTMQCNLAHRSHGISKSKAKYIPRGVAGVVIQKKQAGSPYGQIRMAKRGGLNGSNGYVTGETGSPLL